MTTKQNKRLLWQVPFLVLLIVGTVLIIRQQRSIPYQKASGTIFGTTYHITYQYDDDLKSEIEGRLQEVDNALSMFNKKSIITQINNNQPVQLNDMFIEVFKLSQQVSKDTDGAFDITVAPLVNAWGFGTKSEEMPDQHAIDSLLTIIGYQKVSLVGRQVKKTDARVMLDCSAIAKGYGTDAAARLLKEKGITNYMVEIGGEVVTHGINEQRIPWKIGVTKPTDDALATSHELQTVLNLTDKAMATSGNYRNFYYKGGRRYAHTINPKTGYPVQHNILSATVIADDCARADAYATAFMVMGFDGAKEVLKRNPDLMAYLIYDDDGINRVWYSSGLQDKIAE
jgi:thiamine biosynthesis lipoprotein